ncbi:polyprenyl synthetase family protein [Acetivibrio ethanolgignens]|uniref:Farnesyl diphosphate synthase n=1 Tax=Acetivibrio ethanolgignens TaxID=290052 RepID=A0A0V8QFX7_9FIRM|nr:farnesyl diphosphate synthase [Acetivibrio ethanolgignens]KSV59315.1 farnesyl-diphosphate synthase [Acetivibrio ethanolgignens]
MDFQKELKQKIAETEKAICRYLPEEEGKQKIVIEAMNYSVLAGGKRLRPLLISEAYRALGGCNKDVAEPFMAAMEMIHTYSLVHDDLPAMDNDEYRRGKKTTHAQYGEAIGILAGDGLLNYAFETAVKAFESEEEPQKIARALKLLAQKPGIHGMLGGQVVDVESCDKPVTEELLSYIHTLKTGALIEGSLMIGAALAGADELTLEKMERIGRSVGLAFQIQDDILDVTSTTEILGKPVNSDEKNHKTTYVTLKGLEKARQEVAAYSEEAVGLLQSIAGDTEFLEQLFLWLIRREK